MSIARRFAWYARTVAAMLAGVVGPAGCGDASGSVGLTPTMRHVRLVATPNAASTFAGWSGACAGTAECGVDMSQERTVTATFALPTTGRR